MIGFEANLRSRSFCNILILKSFKNAGWKPAIPGRPFSTPSRPPALHDFRFHRDHTANGHDYGFGPLVSGLGSQPAAARDDPAGLAGRLPLQPETSVSVNGLGHGHGQRPALHDFRFHRDHTANGHDYGFGPLVSGLGSQPAAARDGPAGLAGRLPLQPETSVSVNGHGLGLGQRPRTRSRD